MSNLVKILLVATLACFAGMLGGCSSKPKMGKYNIQVSLDPTLAASAAVPSIEVDIIGVSPARQAVWDAQSLNNYFAAANVERQTADRFTMAFGAGATAPQTLTSGDAMWGKWLGSGATHVYVLASLPGVSTDAAGASDPRRLILPLDTRQWERGQTIQVEVQRNRLELRTAPKPLPVE